MKKFAELFSRMTDTLGFIPRTYRIIWQAAPVWTLAWGFVLILQGILPAATVYLTGTLVDSLVVAIDANGSWSVVKDSVVLALLMGSILLLIELLKGLGEWIRAAQAEYIRDHIKSIVHEKSISVDIGYYETADFYDRLSRVQGDSSSRPLSLLESSGSLLQNLITLSAMAVILISFGVGIPFFLLLSALPAFVVILRFNQRYHNWWEKTTATRRWALYYDVMLTSRTTAAEVRLFDTGNYFRSKYQSLRERLRNDQLNLLRERGTAGLAAGGFALFVSGIVIGWTAWQAILGLITLGSLARFYQAFNQSQTLLRSLLGNVGQIYSNNLFLSNLFEFLELESKLVEPTFPKPLPSVLESRISFNHITFRYPGSTKDVLVDFNLDIPAGKVVAIVGENGAGKTTLSKLLCRFYDPQVGRVELDGVDMREFSLAAIRRHISVLFQFPITYHGTVTENIALGNINYPIAEENIHKAARSAGAHTLISNLPKSYNTLLGKYYADGLDLSGGELQRLALARAFYKQAQIVILDEPTSFMDSWAEMDWLDRFRELVHGRTAVIITHRFTTAMQADIIHVMEAGEIVESGTHAQLLALNGRYAKSWNAQMQSSRKAAAESEISQNGYIPN